MKTVSKVKRHINPKLKIGGILLTMLDSRTNFAKEISSLIRDTYGKNLKISSYEVSPMFSLFFATVKHLLCQIFVCFCDFAVFIISINAFS